MDTVRVEIRINIGGINFSSQVNNMAKAVKVVHALCELNQPPRVFVCVGAGTFQEVNLEDFV